MSIPSWATFDPKTVSGQSPYKVQALLGGKWQPTAKETSIPIPDPMNGEEFMYFPAIKETELQPWMKSLNSCPKSGLHNPFKSPERYVMWGAVTTRMVIEMSKPQVLDFFTRTIMRCCPKTYAQAEGEVKVTLAFLENFCGDNVRYCAKGFNVAGSHLGQRSQGLRWPFGPAVLISTFNFPLEIPVLQMMGALYMGNKVTFKADHRTAVVMDQFLRLMEFCKAPMQDIDFICCEGSVMGKFIEMTQPRVIQFTGSSKVAEHLSAVTRGKVKLEDAGFDWKVLGPDVQQVDYVAWQCDQDAYGHTGQKCSAQSILFMHENWAKANLVDKLQKLSSARSLSDLTIGPLLSVTTQRVFDHIAALGKIPGAKVLFGGKEIEKHTIPKCYGAVVPTAVFVPLKELLKPENFPLCTTEIFGPFQIVTEYKDSELDLVLEALERMNQHLTAAIVSNDVLFQQRCLGATVNGTTYVGIRARTTGAPQNHWFGPAGDPRGGGIGTHEAIRLVWSCHREVIEDFGPVHAEWTTPKAT